jgi:hypothetical protein
MSQLHMPVESQHSRQLAAAVVAPCSGRKSVSPAHIARAISLPVAPQEDLESAWAARLADLDAAVPASRLYAGRGFRLAGDAAALLSAPLFIVSAGLGLVDAKRRVPSYGVTIGGRGSDTIGERAEDQFDADAWWQAVNRGRFASPISVLFRGAMPVLAALTQPYALMLSRSLGKLPANAIGRLRICGLGLAELLPENVRSSVMPYDERLQSIFPGTRADFAQRALYHFAKHVLPVHPQGDAHEHRDAVFAALSAGRTPTRHQRPRLSDEALIDVIAVRLARGPRGIQRTLRALRDEEGIACEQARFTRLYHSAAERVSLP